jgi:hypothetical protein
MQYALGLRGNLRGYYYYLKEYGTLMLEALELVSDGGIISYHTYIAIIHVDKVSGPNLQ